MIDLTSLFMEDHEYRKWNTALLVLSLHGAVEFWPEMGLVVASKAGPIRYAAESAVRRLRVLNDMNGLEQSVYNAHFIEVIASVLQELDASVGRATREVLVSWIRSRFPCVDNAAAQASLWGHAWFANKHEDPAELELSPEKRVQVVRLIKKQREWEKDFFARVDAAANAPAPAWDVQVKADYTEDCSPYDWVLDAGSYAYFLNVWAGFEELLTPEERVRLMEWTIKLGVSQRMNPELIKMPFE